MKKKHCSVLRMVCIALSQSWPLFQKNAVLQRNRGNVCGACTGALMVLGLMYGETHAGDQEGRQRTNRLNDLMMDRFSDVNGSCLCNELLGCDIRTPEGVQYARDNHLFTEFCPKMVASAVEILERILSERE